MAGNFGRETFLGIPFGIWLIKSCLFNPETNTLTECFESNLISSTKFPITYKSWKTGGIKHLLFVCCVNKVWLTISRRHCTLKSHHPQVYNVSFLRSIKRCPLPFHVFPVSSRMWNGLRLHFNRQHWGYRQYPRGTLEPPPQVRALRNPSPSGEA